MLTKIGFWIFSNQCFHYNFQLDYHSYGSYLHFFPGCCFIGTCYLYSHFVVLNKGSHLKFQNEAVTLRLQEDRNLVLSCLTSPIWSSGSHGNAAIKSLVFQENGNLALIKDDTKSHGPQTFMNQREHTSWCKMMAIWHFSTAVIYHREPVIL